MSSENLWNKAKIWGSGGWWEIVWHKTKWYCVNKVTHWQQNNINLITCGVQVSSIQNYFDGEEKTNYKIGFLIWNIANPYKLKKITQTWRHCIKSNLKSKVYGETGSVIYKCVYLWEAVSQTCSTTAQKMKLSIKDFFSKCDQILSFLRIWSHLLKKSLTL